MKVLFFLGFPNPFPGAGWTRIGFFAKYFKDRGYDVAVIGTFSPKSLGAIGFKSWKGVSIYNVVPTFWVENTFSLVFNVLSSMIVLPIIFLILRPKVVVISLPTGEPAVGAYFASKIIRAKIVFDVRDEWEDYVISKASSKAFRRAYKLLKALMTSLYNKGDLVVTVTPSVARSLRLRGIKKVKILPNGADINVFRPYKKDVVRRRLGRKNDEFIIVYEGGIGGYYRLDVGIRALARLSNEFRNKMRLLIVGSGEVSNLLSLAENLGLKDNIIYLGVKKDKVELAQILSAGDVGIVLYDDNPLWKNSIPAKFYEYCACGLPVIATVYDDSLLAGIIKEHQIGLTTPPMDENKLSEAITWLYRNMQLRETMGMRARKLIEEKFDRNKIADEFLKLIEGILSDE
ncbi:MAG: glycosyltransferase family 4 protein [Thermofilum sp.]|nr:glycosyltransferase family 4 protein [Thermofilum sp.]